MTREMIIGEIRRIAGELGTKQLPRSEFRTHSSIPEGHIYRLFDSWNEAVAQADLVPHTENKKIAEDELFIEMRRVFLHCGGICTRTKFANEAKYSTGVYERYGYWNGAKRAFRVWLEENSEEFPFMDQLPEDVDYSPARDEDTEQGDTEEVVSWNAVGGAIYGEPLNFRGLQHEPLNEQGVVFLFGMVCRELNFIVESVRSKYPDCEAKRRIASNRWERVKIEFEHRSANFRRHRHDPDQCDLIICWIDDWEECPLEVIELRSVIRDLPNS